MKKQILLLALLAGNVYACMAQKEKIEVPAAVEKSFAKQFPGATAKWEKEKGSYEASFKQNGTSMSAVFGATGALEETEATIKSTELPAPVLAYVKDHKKNAAIKEAAKITKSSGEVNYEAEVNGKDLIFDESGKFIKEEKD
ncbi:MAG: PepSY-like domain-containing protein [Chitinophagaceae bacterium]